MTLSRKRGSLTALRVRIWFRNFMSDVGELLAVVAFLGVFVVFAVVIFPILLVPAVVFILALIVITFVPALWAFLMRPSIVLFALLLAFMLADNGYRLIEAFIRLIERV